MNSPYYCGSTNENKNIPYFCCDDYVIVKVDDLNDITVLDRNHAYLLPNNTVWVWNYAGNWFVQLNSEGSGDITAVSNTDGYLTVSGSGTTNVVVNINKDEIAQLVKDTVTELLGLGTYTLSFQTNGGTTIDSVSFLVMSGGRCVNLSEYTTTKAGYTFEGWYSDAALTNKVTCINLTQDTTVYAKWEEEISWVTITFNANGGTGTMESQTVGKGIATALKTNTYVNSGSSFAGWSTVNAGEVEYGDGATITANDDMTLYAIWKYDPSQWATITFETNGGTTIDSVSKLIGSNVDLSEYTTERSYYDFTGWYSEAELTNAITSVTLTGDITVYAGWIANELIFETNGGTTIETIIFETVTKLYLEEYTTTKEGYTFEGWYSDAELTTGPVGSVIVKGKTTIYASWVAN